ncbi:hypothetical protein QU481_03255 [Crenobacter sp. SG2303]|uniref:DUF2628 domain-containing protein n=1 Tax=Crenobacter oryzisoli TaxID=3056844 RepID=A0ABT7XJD9_9NEIS|nr:hypothetical protein [Crenobacter sp. SG2303]MDN0073909.1 hypothetical protein [Crenobacter sp. SG2303]
MLGQHQSALLYQRYGYPINQDAPAWRYAITHLFTPNGIYGAWGRLGLIGYTIGFVATIPFFVLAEVYIDLIAKLIGGVDIGWLVGLLVSGISYYALSRSLDVASEETAIQSSEWALGSLTAVPLSHGEDKPLPAVPA